MGCYVVFNHPLSLHRCMEDFSTLRRWKYPKELKFEGRHRLKVRNLGWTLQGYMYVYAVWDYNCSAYIFHTFRLWPGATAGCLPRNAQCRESLYAAESDDASHSACGRCMVQHNERLRSGTLPDNFRVRIYTYIVGESGRADASTGVNFRGRCMPREGRR